MTNQLNSTQEEITKIYKYIRNGKNQTVKRCYVIKGENKAKKSELEDYFLFDYKKDLNIKENYRLFNKDVEYPTSFSMLYRHYKKYFV